MSDTEESSSEESLIYAMHITTPDHIFGWVIIIDDEMTVRVAVSGNKVLERVILNEPNTTINYQAWDMVIHTLGLSGPRDEYQVSEVSTSIPRKLTERIMVAETDEEQNSVINDLAVYIGKEIAS